MTADKSVKNFTSELGEISVDFRADYLSVFSLVNDFFKSMVEENNFFALQGTLETLNVEPDVLNLSNLEDYLIESENGKITIAEKTYTLPSYMFEIIYQLTSRVLFDISNRHIISTAEQQNKKQAGIRRDMVIKFRMFYFKNLRKERNLNLHSDKSKIIKTETGFVFESYNSKQEYIDSLIHTAMLDTCLEYLSDIHDYTV